MPYCSFPVTRLCPILPLLLFCLCDLRPAFAQNLPEGAVRRSGSFRLSLDSTVFFNYYELKDSLALGKFAAKAKQTNFPVVVIKQPVFDPLLALFQNQEALVDSLLRIEEKYMALDDIQQEKVKQLEQLVAVQKERAENYRELSDTMCNTNKELSAQMDQALKVAKDCNNGKVRKQWLIGILGGAVGFSVAGLIALVK
jgi:hypothetical protein